ncbi:SKP1-like protein [archaeon]|nr:MAG: SKP1-like protein [archaeon]
MAATTDEIVLTSQEGERHVIPRRVAQMSGLLSTMTEDGFANEEIPLMDVRSPVLKKVIEFCTHHVDQRLPEIEKPLVTSNLRDIVPDWDAAFVDVDMEMLFELILAANYMDVKSLLDLTCAKVATMIKGTSPARASRVRRACVALHPRHLLLPRSRLAL